MGLKTNSKIVNERIRQLIVDEATLENYGIDDTGLSWEQVAVKIKEIAMGEKDGDYYCRTMTPYERFADWCRGLPSTFSCSWLYSTSAVKVLGDILEQTEEERSKYEETQSENLLMSLMWRQMELAERRLANENRK